MTVQNRFPRRMETSRYLVAIEDRDSTGNCNVVCHIFCDNIKAVHQALVLNTELTTQAFAGGSVRSYYCNGHTAANLPAAAIKYQASRRGRYIAIRASAKRGEIECSREIVVIPL